MKDLKNFMEENNLNYEDTAQILETYREKISDIVRGKMRPGIDIIIKMIAIDIIKRDRGIELLDKYYGFSKKIKEYREKNSDIRGKIREISNRRKIMTGIRAKRYKEYLERRRRAAGEGKGFPDGTATEKKE